MLMEDGRFDVDGFQYDKGAMQCFGSLVPFVGYDIMFYVLPRIIIMLYLALLRYIRIAIFDKIAKIIVIQLKYCAYVQCIMHTLRFCYAFYSTSTSLSDNKSMTLSLFDLGTKNNDAQLNTPPGMPPPLIPTISVGATSVTTTTTPDQLPGSGSGKKGVKGRNNRFC